MKTIVVIKPLVEGIVGETPCMRVAVEHDMELSRLKELLNMVRKDRWCMLNTPGKKHKLLATLSVGEVVNLINSSRFKVKLRYTEETEYIVADIQDFNDRWTVWNSDSNHFLRYTPFTTRHGEYLDKILNTKYRLALKEELYRCAKVELRQGKNCYYWTDGFMNIYKYDNRVIVKKTKLDVVTKETYV